MTKFKVGGQAPITFDRFIRGILLLLIIIGVALAVYHLSGVLLPFFVAWLAAYLLYPVVRFFQQRLRLRNRFIAIFATLLVTIGALVGFFYLVVPPMINEMGHLKDVALNYIREGANLSRLPLPVQEYLTQRFNPHEVEAFLSQTDILSAIKNTLPKVWNVLWSTASLIFNLAASLIGLLYFILLLTDYEKYATGWIHFVPRSLRPFAATLVADIEHGMAGYFRGQALVALSNCVMFSIGFWIIDFPMPIGLGCLIGVISFVPYLQVIGFIPAALLAVLTSFETGANFWWLLFLVLVVYVVVQILQDTIFTPRIMGKIMGLPPAIILLSLSVGGYLLGILGLILALPVTTLMITYYRRFVIGGDTKHLTDGLDEESLAVERAAGIYVEPTESSHQKSVQTPPSSSQQAAEITSKTPSVPTSKEK